MTRSFRIASLLVATTFAFACRAQPSDEEGAGDEATSEASADETPAASAGEATNDEGPRPTGIQGAYRGDLDQAGRPVEGHVVEVLTDGDGNPQIGIWEFCNIDMRGSGTEYTSVPGASCLIDLGEGPKPFDAAATAQITSDHLEVRVVFGDNAATWKFEGSR